MESIASLRAILVSALNTGGIESGEQELFDELTVNRPRLIKVFDFGPRSQQEQREIESGRVVVDGHPLQVNAEFARQVAFISQQLNCSERYCAGFLHSVLTENPTINQIEAVEQAILAFHETRRELADCLRFVFEAADAAEKADALPVHARLNDFVKRQLVGSTSEGSVAYHIFAELNNSGAAIANARAAVTNAVSNTNVPGPQGGNANLGHAVLAARLESLLYERRTLAFAFYFVARAGYLSSAELRQVLEWLERNPRNDMTLYILATLFAALDLSHSPPGSPGAELRVAITNDSAFMSFMRRNLAPTTDWKDLALRATVHLKWTLFLTEARFRNTSLEHVEGFRNEDLEMQVFNAVQGDAFTFLLHVVSQLSAVRSTASQLLSNSLSSSTSPDAAELKGTVPEEFKLNLLHEIELLLRSLLTHAPAELRKIKHKQEDQFRPRGDRHMRASFKPAESAVDPLPTRNDIATLFQLLGHLYSALPTDSAIQFWGGVPNTEAPAYYELAEAELGKLPSFLRWAVEVREPDLVISVFDMLAGLSTGVACSECAYNFMATGTLDVIHGTGAGVGGRYEMSVAFTWGSIFGELETWAALGAGQRGQHGAPPPQLPIAPTDVLLGLAFLRLLSAVATHSVQARIAVFSHPQYRAVGCLVSLIPLGVPLELKGALFETLSAFCLPGAGIPGVEICKSVWAQMERLEVINVRGGGFASKGVEVELEEVESVYKVYPATIPFLELLSTLIHTPKRVPLKNRVTEPEPINTVPENLGQPYRAPGIGPFVSFVVDNVLAKLTRREFLDPFDNSKMTDLSLCFVERCLASFDLESLPSLAEEYNVKGPEVLFPVIQHPGFDVLSRILSETPLRATLISFVVEGADELHRQPTNSRFAKVLLRALRIMDRVLAIQDIFLDHLVPALSELDSTSLVGSKISQSFLSRIDQGLSLDHRSVPAIGSYVNFPANPETMFLAIKILASLSQSPSFQNISALIERSSESTIILDGFVRLLASDSADDVGAAEEWTDLWTGAGAPDLEDEQDLFAQAIRVAILDLLLRGTKHNKSSSLAFLLLFGKVAPDAQIQDPHALGSRAFCLHVVLHLLNTGVPRLTGSGKGKEKEKRRAVKAIPLFESQPVLAERLYKLIYQLCEHSRTSSPLMLYLRTREDFFARHLSAMAVHAPFDARTPFIEVLYGDGSRVATTCTTMKAFLRLRSWLLDLVSLELHVLTNKGQNQRVKDLLDLLFGTTDSYHESESDWEHDVFRPFNDVSQSRIRLIELFQSLEFEWYDSVTVTPVDLQFYTTLNLQSCVRADENGCEVVDRTALFELLSNARRTLMRQGQIASTAHNTQLDAETRYILESCVVENNRREVQFALNVSYESWKRLADVVLTKCFGRIAHDQRENILFDLLHVLPPAIRVTALPESSAILLSEVLFLLITKLREERRQAYLLSSGDSLDSSALPEERMATLLRHILDCILDKNRRELVRGNIYAALVNFLHLVIQPSGDDVSLKNSSLPLEASLSSMASSLTLSGSEIMRPQSPTSSLELNSFTIMKQSMDRLVTTVSKDAIDGTEVWKTVAFTLLESLARLSRLDTKHLVLTTLERYGLLSNFVHSIKDADSSLQDVLRPEPDDLNPLYVYEAKMSFLIRIAQTRQGAERLLESRILPILSQVDFLDARPEADESFLDHNSFLPSAISRYHELLVPALQLVGAIVATVGSKHAVASKQALDFLYNHRDTFVIMLKQETTLLALSTIEELDLLVSLCAFVVLSVPQTDFYATNSGFGSIHNAILALAARTLGTSKWLSAVRPTDETEIVESQTPASGYGVNDSKFDIKVRQVVQKTRKTVMRYLSAASSVGESELIIVLSPMMTTRRDERSSAVTVPLPSLQDTIDVLNGLCDELLSTMQEIVDISAELEHRDHVRIDNVEELVGGVDADAVRRLDVAQRRSLVCRFYERTVLTKKTRTDTLISTIEMLLHLLWTHISYYISERASSPDTFDRHKPLNRSQLSQSQSHLKSSTLRFLTVPDPGSFRADAAAALARIVEKVEGIELSEDFAGRSWRSKQSYLEVMCRCLREAVAVDSAASGDGRE